MGEVMDFDELDELLSKYVFSANFDGDASEERKEIHDWARRAILGERQRCAAAAKAYMEDIAGCSPNDDEPDLIARAILNQ